MTEELVTSPGGVIVSMLQVAGVLAPDSMAVCGDFTFMPVSPAGCWTLETKISIRSIILTGMFQSGGGA